MVAEIAIVNAGPVDGEYQITRLDTRPARTQPVENPQHLETALPRTQRPADLTHLGKLDRFVRGAFEPDASILLIVGHREVAQHTRADKIHAVSDDDRRRDEPGAPEQDIVGKTRPGSDHHTVDAQ